VHDAAEVMVNELRERSMGQHCASRLRDDEVESGGGRFGSRIKLAANSGIQRNDKTTNLSVLYISHSMHWVSTRYTGRGATELSALIHRIRTGSPLTLPTTDMVRARSVEYLGEATSLLGQMVHVGFCRLVVAMTIRSIAGGGTHIRCLLRHVPDRTPEDLGGMVGSIGIAATTSTYP
jgi:hypothetical protein